MRILIVGYGRMGQRRALACLALGHNVCVVEPNDRRRFFVAPGVSFQIFDQYRAVVPFYASLHDAPACDAAFICTPAGTHAEVVSTMAKTNVVFEKPLDVTRERGVGAAYMTRGERACVAYSWRFHPVVRDFRAAIAASGDLRVLRFTCFAPKRLWSSPPKVGQLWPECSHEVDLACWITGGPLRVSEAVYGDVSVDAALTNGAAKHISAHVYVSIDDAYPANRRIFEAITSTERIVMAADGIDESVYDEETATILSWFEGVEDDRICTLAQAQRVLEVVV